MRYLGIDYGSKKIGLALSDETGRLAFPLLVLANDQKIFEALAGICRSEKVQAAVIGESRDFKGKPNLIWPAAERFKKKLEQYLKLPVYREPEFFSSKQAERIQGRSKNNDASAAAIILQSFLDKNRSAGFNFPT